MAIILGRKPGGSGGGGGAPSGPAGGDLSGTYPNPDIAAGAVGATELADNAVDTNAIQNNAVTAAKVAADVATQAELDAAAALLTPVSGWIDDSANTWTRTADTTFTVTGDRTSTFTKGTRLRWTQTTVKYGTVVLSAHAAGTTTVTIAPTVDYVLTAAAISVNSYSYAASPQGYPTWFTWTPVYSGFSAAPSGTGLFSIVGTACTVILTSGNGTSNATTFGVTLPVASIYPFQVASRITNNGATPTAPGKFNFPAASDAATLNLDFNNGAFTASGNKACVVQATYQI